MTGREVISPLQKEREQRGCDQSTGEDFWDTHTVEPQTLSFTPGKHQLWEVSVKLRQTHP